jgi:hypothetical protein
VVRLPESARPLFPALKPAYTLATRLVAPVSVRLSRRRGGHLPTGVVATLEEAAVASGGRAVTVRPEQALLRSLPARSPTPQPVFAERAREVIPRVALAELPGARVLGPHRAIVTRNGELLQELSVYFGTSRPREHPLFLSPFPPAPERISGRLGVLATQGDRNYYHFLVDVLPRLAIAAGSPSIPAPDRWYVPAEQGFQRELLELAGVSEDQRVDASTVPHVVADTLVVPGLPSTIVRNPPWATAYLRELLLPAGLAATAGRGVYVTRGQTRNNRVVRNEADVVGALTARGFAVIDPSRMTVREQIEAFATADVIVAPHGAALANLVFASPGSAVVELFPAGHARADYWMLANGVPGLDYFYLMGTGRPVRSHARFLVADITVDVAGLTGLVDSIRATTRPGR